MLSSAACASGSGGLVASGGPRRFSFTGGRGCAGVLLAASEIGPRPAAAAASEDPYEIAFIDWQMPAMDGLATIAHTGDSRAYLVRNGQTRTRTYDHSRVQMLIDAGELSEEQAQTHPQRNLVITCLGGDIPPRIDVAQAIRLEAGDTIALCSDGVWGPLGEQLSAGLIYPLERAVPTLLERAELLAGPSCDNLSLIVLRWESAAGRPQSDEKTGALTGHDTLIEDFTRTLPRPLAEHEIAAAITAVKGQIAGTRSFKPASEK